MDRFIIYAVSIFVILSNVGGTPLDDYVNTPDSVFSWKRLQTYPQSLYTLYVLNMTSQQWMDGTVRFYKMSHYSSLF
jgi:hypothetical protein